MRTRGSGGVIKLQNSKYLYISYYQDGKQHRESAHTASKSVAEEMLRSRLAQVGNNVPVESVRKLKYEQVMGTLLLEYKNQGHASLLKLPDGTETVSGKKHVDSFFKGKLVKNITTDALRQFVAKRQESSAANGTINRNLALLRAALNLARKEGKIQNVVHFPMLSEAGNERQGFVEPDVFEKLLGVLPEVLRPLIQFMYDTGCRLGAARQIEWSWVHLDLARPEIWFPHTVTKNGKPLALVITPELASMLKKEFRTDGPVFVTTNLRKAWYKACVSLGLGTLDGTKYEGLIIHDLRRSGVRNLVRSGVPEAVAMKISQHETRAVFERYNIIDTKDVGDAMEKMMEYRREKLRTSARTSQVAVMPVGDK